MRQISIDEVLKVTPETRKAFKDFVDRKDRKMDRKELAKALCNIPFLPQGPARLMPDTTRKTERDFSKQIKRWARKIEKVNGRGLLYAQLIDARIEEHNPQVLRKTRGKNKELLEAFKSLPAHLNAYADYYQRVVKRRQDVKQQGKLRPDNNLQRFAIGRLIYAVDKAVGSPSYGKISLLLDAAFSAAKQKASISLDEDNLRVYYRTFSRPLFNRIRAAAGKHPTTPILPFD